MFLMTDMTVQRSWSHHPMPLLVILRTPTAAVEQERAPSPPTSTALLTGNYSTRVGDAYLGSRPIHRSPLSPHTRMRSLKQERRQSKPQAFSSSTTRIKLLRPADRQHRAPQRQRQRRSWAIPRRASFEVYFARHRILVETS